MPSESMFPDDPADTRIEILRATDAALCEYGYADLTIERIGDHFPKSKSLIYHHYEGKDELLRDFLGYLLEDFEASLGVDPDLDAKDRLQRLLEKGFAPESDDEAADFRAAIVELRAQAATDDGYRAHFSDHDDRFRDGIAAIITDGIEEGVCNDVDPMPVATTIQALVTGAMAQQATTDSFDPAVVRDEIDAYLEDRLFAEGR